MAPGLERVDPRAVIPVIVQFQMPPGEDDHGKVRARGGVLKRKLNLIQAAAYSVPAAALRDLAANPRIRYISPDRPVHGSLNYAAPTVHAPLAWQYGWDGTAGSGGRIAGRLRGNVYRYRRR